MCLNILQKITKILSFERKILFIYSIIICMKKSLKNISSVIIQFIFFIVVFFIPIKILPIPFLYANVMGSDLGFLYGRTFLNPEHGRYIATWFGNILMERLPVLLNIHPLDFNCPFILTVKIFLSIIIFSTVSYGFLLFFDKKNKNDIWIWLLGYIVSFLLLFNHKSNFLWFQEITIFLEYIVAIIPYLIFISGIIYFFTIEKIPTKPISVLIMLAAFFSGITVEVLNVPSLMFITLVTLFVCIRFLRSERTNVIAKQRFNFFLSLFFIHLFSVILYYINPNDHEVYNRHILSDFWNFSFAAWRFIFLDLLPFHILNIVTAVLILILRKKEQKQNIRFISCLSLCHLCFIFNFTIILCFVLCFVKIDIVSFLGDIKNIDTYVILLLFSNFLLLGYLISSYTSLNEKKLYILKILAIIIVLITNFKFIDKNFSDYTEKQANDLKHRQQLYKIEKSIVKQRGKDTIIIPTKNFNYKYYMDFSHFVLLSVIYYPDFQNMKTIVTDENLAPEELTEKEKANLNFSNLLPHKINKFEGDYHIFFEKEKEENSKVYYKRLFFE